MTIRDLERTVAYDEKWIAGGDIRELRKAVEDFTHDMRGVGPDSLSWRIETGYLVLSARMSESTAG